MLKQETQNERNSKPEFKKGSPKNEKCTQNEVEEERIFWGKSKMMCKLK